MKNGRITNHGTIDMIERPYIHLAKLEPGDHEFVVVIDGKSYNIAIRVNCASAEVHRWSHGVNTGSRYDSAAKPAWATLGRSAILSAHIILRLEEIAGAIATINNYNTMIGLGLMSW
jgi:hypothetical protein